MTNTIKQRIKQYDKQHKDSKAYVMSMLEDEDMKVFAEWVMTEPYLAPYIHNPHPCSWSDMESLLSYVQHAVVDDGDMTFVMIDEHITGVPPKPRMLLRYWGDIVDDNYKDGGCLTEAQCEVVLYDAERSSDRFMKEHFPSCYKSLCVTINHELSLNQFVALCREHQAAREERACTLDKRLTVLQG